MYALDYYVNWRATVEVADREHRDATVLSLLRDVARNPEAHGVTEQEASEAVERFVTLAGQTLEREGGNPSWLRREFERTS